MFRYEFESELSHGGNAGKVLAAVFWITSRNKLRSWKGKYSLQQSRQEEQDHQPALGHIQMRGTSLRDHLEKDPSALSSHPHVQGRKGMCSSMKDRQRDGHLFKTEFPCSISHTDIKRYRNITNRYLFYRWNLHAQKDEAISPKLPSRSVAELAN